MVASIDGATAVAGVSGGLAAFIVVAITWRLPATVNALARDPALAAVEMITLLAAGTGLWLELANASHGPGQLPRPARAAMAAAAMWTIWVLAYLTGMSSASWFAAYHHGVPAGGLNAAADQGASARPRRAALLPVVFAGGACAVANPGANSSVVGLLLPSGALHQPLHISLQGRL